MCMVAGSWSTRVQPHVYGGWQLVHKGAATCVWWLAAGPQGCSHMHVYGGWQLVHKGAATCMSFKQQGYVLHGSMPHAWK